MSHRILVTGASRGIGKAIAIRLAEDGHRLALQFKSNQTAAGETLASLKGDGHVLIQADLGLADASRNLAGEAVQALGGIDALVNNAGIHEYHPPFETSHEQWERIWRETLEVNLLAPMLLSHALLNELKQGGPGRIVNIGSRGAYRGEPQGPAYASAKAGLHAGMQSMAQALAPEGIMVFSVAPGFVATEMAEQCMVGEAGEAIRAQSPLNRVAKPEELGQIVAFLLSGEGDWMTGSVLDANGASYLR